MSFQSQVFVGLTDADYQTLMNCGIDDIVSFVSAFTSVTIEGNVYHVFTGDSMQFYDLLDENGYDYEDFGFLSFNYIASTWTMGGTPFYGG